MPQDKAVRWPDIPEPMRDVFGQLWNEVSVLHGKWNVCRELVRSPGTVEALNQAGPIFFALILESLWHDMATTIGRLLDPARDGAKRENISLARLVDGMVECDQWQIKGAKDHLQEAVEHCKDIMLIRNKRIAHADLKVAFHPHANAMPELPDDYMPKALRLIANVMCWVQVCYMQETTDFNSPEPGQSTARVVEILRVQ